MKRVIYILPFISLLTGCGEKPYITFYDKNISQEGVDCLKLDIFPPNKDINRFVHTLYDGFKDDCRYRLKISTKDSIHCSSTANVPQKVNSNFPSSYLRFDLYRGLRLVYGYYIDLTSPADKDDVEDAFDRMKEDINLKN